MLRRAGVDGGGFQAPPGPGNDATRLVVLGEFVAGRGFEHNHLYLEYVVDADPEVWKTSAGASASLAVRRCRLTSG